MLLGKKSPLSVTEIRIEIQGHLSDQKKKKISILNLVKVYFSIRESGLRDKHNVVSLVFALSFLGLHFLRMWGAIYQMTKGEIRGGCLQYDPEREMLIKTPFGADCFRGLGNNSGGRHRIFGQKCNLIGAFYLYFSFFI